MYAVKKINYFKKLPKNFVLRNEVSKFEMCYGLKKGGDVE